MGFAPSASPQPRRCSPWRAATRREMRGFRGRFFGPDLAGRGAADRDLAFGRVARARR
jgi:hypothetical protein